MLRIRVIPCLLLKGQGLVKTVKYKDPKYVGDPINAIKIFNDKEVDELMLLDITASVEGRGPSFEIIKDVASECFMPLAYGGGIRNLDDIRRILATGVEKVVLNTAAIGNPELIQRAAQEFGSQAIVVSIDVKKRLFGGYEVMSARGSRKTGFDPVSFAKRVVELGAGELLVSAIDRDGMQQGYDLELVEQVTSAVNVPVISSGGAASVDDFIQVCAKSGAAAVAAGSMFVFTGPHRAVLITYPTKDQLRPLWHAERK
ncbi:MAG: imidazole glycerol phosphate synthase subunit HisF [Burkholderiales bacterium RIFCSPLOWO2_02_FULL_57_36]|nr:MAG: imidazole glycerol phosphate synthase subunit HisF [Burkholderiales bacterium RIFCSPLOWO2_02_FULL_57_36]